MTQSTVPIPFVETISIPIAQRTEPHDLAFDPRAHEDVAVRCIRDLAIAMLLVVSERTIVEIPIGKHQFSIPRALVLSPTAVVAISVGSQMHALAVAFSSFKLSVVRRPVRPAA